MPWWCDKCQSYHDDGMWCPNMGLLDPIIDVGAGFVKGWQEETERQERELGRQRKEFDSWLAESQMKTQMAIARAEEEAVRRKREDYMFLLPKVEKTMLAMKRDSVSVSPVAALLERAKNAFDKADYVNAYESLRLAEKKANEILEFYNEAPKLISSAKEAIKAGNERGIKLKETEKLLSRAEQEFEEGKYQEACELAEQANNTSKKLEDLYVKTAGILSSVEKALPPLQDEGINIDDAERSISTAKRALEKGRYRDAHFTAEHINERVKGLKASYTRAVTTISSAEKTLADIKSKGIKVGKAEQLISEAKQAFDDGNYENAYTLADQSAARAKEMEDIHDKAANAIRSAEKAGGLIRNLGVSGDRVLGWLEQAQRAFDGGNYERALNLSKQAFSKSNEIERAHDELENTRPYISHLSNSGLLGSIRLRISGVQKILDNAENSFKSCRYTEAEELAVEARKKADGFIYVASSYLIFVVWAPIKTIYNMISGPRRRKYEAEERYEKEKAEVIAMIEEAVAEE